MPKVKIRGTSYVSASRILTIVTLPDQTLLNAAAQWIVTDHHLPVPTLS